MAPYGPAGHQSSLRATQFERRVRRLAEGRDPPRSSGELRMRWWPSAFSPSFGRGPRSASVRASNQDRGAGP